MTVMGYLMHVKDRAVTTDDMFQPLTETIELLKFYDMDIPEEVNVLLQVNTVSKIIDMHVCVWQKSVIIILMYCIFRNYQSNGKLQRN